MEQNETLQQKRYLDALHRAWDDIEMYGNTDDMSDAVFVNDPRTKPPLIGANLDIDNFLSTQTEYSYDKPLYFDNLDHKTKDLEFDEVGFAENIDLTDQLDAEHEKLSAEIRKQFSELVDFEDDQVARLRKVVEDNIAAFGTKSSPARMSHLHPITCQLKSDAEIISQPRWLGREQMEFLRKRIDSMLARGLVRHTPNPHYGSQAFLVPKKGGDKYRMVVDMRKLN